MNRTLFALVTTLFVMAASGPAVAQKKPNILEIPRHLQGVPAEPEAW